MMCDEATKTSSKPGCPASDGCKQFRRDFISIGERVVQRAERATQILHTAEHALDCTAPPVLSALTQCSITRRSPRSEPAKPD
jgi:hypothetical protein